MLLIQLPEQTANPAVEAEVVSLDGGKMIVNLKKNIEAPFLDKVNDDKTKEEFTLLALSVNIKQTAEEVKGDIQPTVVSDWARLVETKATPYIHYTKYIDEKGAISTEEEKMMQFLISTIIKLFILLQVIK